MAVLLIDAFSVIILNLALPCSSFYYDTSWNCFDCEIHWKYFCLWNFLAVLWIVILPCNTFIVVLSDNTFRVATRQGKVREIEFFSRSGNCQRIL